jgi:hypothetical protein
MLCTMKFESGDFEATEQALFEFIEDYAHYDQWKHQAFLLLVDTYMGLGDWFQARATAESILEYVAIEEIRAKATEKRAEIDRLEWAELNPPAPTTLDSTQGAPSTNTDQNAPQP